VLLYIAVVIKCSNAQIPVHRWGLLLQIIYFALVTKADIQSYAQLIPTVAVTIQTARSITQ